MNSIQLGKFLGWFSLGLGVAEMIAPGRLRRSLGLPVPPLVVAAFGAREIGAGLAALTYPGSPGPIWARVGGDVLDLAVLASALGQDGRRGKRVALATAAVLGVTVLDIACAAAFVGRRRMADATAKRTRIRRIAA